MNVDQGLSHLPNGVGRFSPVVVNTSANHQDFRSNWVSLPSLSPLKSSLRNLFRANNIFLARCCTMPGTPR